MNALERAIYIVGGQTKLAVGISDWLVRNGRTDKTIKQQHVWKWLNNSSGIPTVPPEYRMAIEEITEGRVTSRELSHDIYGVIADSSCKHVSHDQNN